MIITFKPLKLNTDSVFDLSINEYDKNYQKINLNEYKLYIEKQLSNKLLSYEHDEIPSIDEIYDLAKKAHQRYLDRNTINSVNIKSDIFVKVNGKSLLFV